MNDDGCLWSIGFGFGIIIGFMIACYVNTAYMHQQAVKAGAGEYFANSEGESEFRYIPRKVEKNEQ